MNKIDVLDHGYVRLLNHMGDDLTVVRRARHMPDAEWRDSSQTWNDAKLISYLMRHRHTSPFEFVEFDWEIKAPIFVARQWVRHRTWNMNEISGRYQELPAEFYTPEPGEVGVQAKGNKQGRDLNPAGEDKAFNRAGEVGAYKARCEASFREYYWLLDMNWPRELARCVLPLSTYTVFSAKVDLHNLLHFLRLRLDVHAQHEIRVYAEVMLSLIEPIVPITIEAWRCAK